MRLPRVMIAAPRSGSGKTIITCGLLSLLKDRGTDIASYKCGPDYIDPMFHRSVIGVAGGNLDTFFSSGEELRDILSRSDHEAAVLEGVMGIYDGIAGSDGQGSCYDAACATDTPIVLAIDVKGMGQTMISIIRGLLLDDDRCMIRGIVLNRIAARYYQEIAPYITGTLDRISEERGADVRLLGGIPNSPDIHLESRHLGLLMPDELEDLKGQVGAAARLVSEHVDIPALLEIMESAGGPDTAPDGSGEQEAASAAPEGARPIRMPGDSAAPDAQPVLAVARDEAFCFYYEENLRMIKDAGIRIIEFSPLHDRCVPEDADGLLLGGGYPELYAFKLSANISMLESVRNAIASGMPSLAECGGFMYLMDTLEDKEGHQFPAAGVIPGRSYYTGRLSRFGYVTVTGKGANGDIKSDQVQSDVKTCAKTCVSLLSGLSVRGHEFHYYDSSNNGSDAVAVKPGSGRSWDCIHADENHIWGFPHLYYPSCPELIHRIYDSMIAYRDK